MKKVLANSETLNPIEDEQLILTLEHKPMNNSLFLLRNKEFCPMGEENKIVNSDSFFGLIHLESGEKINISKFTCGSHLFFLIWAFRNVTWGGPGPGG